MSTSLHLLCDNRRLQCLAVPDLIHAITLYRDRNVLLCCMHPGVPSQIATRRIASGSFRTHAMKCSRKATCDGVSRLMTCSGRDRIALSTLAPWSEEHTYHDCKQKSTSDMVAGWQLSARRGTDVTMHCRFTASLAGHRISQTGLLSRRERYRRLCTSSSSNRGYERSRYDISRRSHLSLTAGLLTTPFLPAPVFGGDSVTGKKQSAMPASSALNASTEGAKRSSMSAGIDDFYDQLQKRVSEFTLDNGLHFIVLERHVAPVVSCHIYADVGAFDEPEGQTGMLPALLNTPRIVHCLQSSCINGHHMLHVRHALLLQGSVDA